MVHDHVSATTRMVRAASQAQAIRYIARDRFSADPANGEDVALGYENGLKVEDSVEHAFA